MCAGGFRGHKSSNRIKLSSLIQDLLFFTDLGSFFWHLTTHLNHLSPLQGYFCDLLVAPLLNEVVFSKDLSLKVMLLYWINYRSKFTIISHFSWNFTIASFPLKSKAVTMNTFNTEIDMTFHYGFQFIISYCFVLDLSKLFFLPQIKFPKWVHDFVEKCAICMTIYMLVK